MTSILSAGALLAAAQVVLIRRALALSGGDETVFGLTLTIWLLSVAAGGAIGSRIARGAQAGRDPSARLRLAVGLIALSIFSALSPILLPLTAALTGWIPGAASGGGGLFLALIASVSLVGISGGALFPLGCATLASSSAHPISLTYLLEAIGSFLGGTVTALIFLPHFSGFSILFLLSGLSLAAAVPLLIPHRINIIVAFSVMLLCVVAVRPISRWDENLLSLLRSGQELIGTLETPYGVLELYESSGQKAAYENGLLLAVSDDPATSEERAHLLLSQHPHPQNVLWIGGSLGQAAAEAIRHPSLRQLQILELNPALWELQNDFAENSTSPITESRLSRLTGDGRRFLARCHPASYDMICLNLPGPKTARLSKFYTVEGFQLMQRALRPDGLLLFSIEASEDYIGPDLANLLSSIQATLLMVFPQVHVLPGGNALFIAGGQDSHPALQPDSIISRLLVRGIEPLYWDRYRLADRLSPSRREMLQQALTSAPTERLNRDLQPMSFFLQQIVWSHQVRGGWAEIWRAAGKGLPLAAWIFILSSLGFALMRLLGQRRCNAGFAAGWAVFFVGLSGLAQEILALILYQIQFGSGYREVGLLVGLYMLGLAAGSYSTTYWIKDRFSTLLRIQAAWLIMPLILVILTAGRLDAHELAHRFLFMAYLLLLGWLGGMHFPLAVDLFGGRSSSRAGLLYALDLTGAAAGAVLFGIFALPILSLTVSALQLALLSLPPLLLLLKCRPSA